MSRIMSVVLLLVLASSASAQIFYEPVEYQYDAGGTKYYYGGSNPAVHAVAQEPTSASGTWGRGNGYAFRSGDVRVYREVVSEPTRIYSDATRLSNARLLGYTIDDARNQAYANAARYFVKRDLPSVVVPKDGRWIVPASAKTIRIFKSSGQEVTPPAPSMPLPLLIIPKDAIERPAPSHNKMVRAD